MADVGQWLSSSFATILQKSPEQLYLLRVVIHMVNTSLDPLTAIGVRLFAESPCGNLPAVDDMTPK